MSVFSERMYKGDVAFAKSFRCVRKVQSPEKKRKSTGRALRSWTNSPRRRTDRGTRLCVRREVCHLRTLGVFRMKPETRKFLKLLTKTILLTGRNDRRSHSQWLVSVKSQASAATIRVKFSDAVAQNEVAYAKLASGVSLKSEVIRIRGDYAELQVFEDTTGLKAGDDVEFTGELLSVELRPGLLTQVFDGLQNPLPRLAQECGFFLQRGKYLRRFRGIRNGHSLGREAR